MSLARLQLKETEGLFARVGQQPAGIDDLSERKK